MEGSGKAGLNLEVEKQSLSFFRGSVAVALSGAWPFPDVKGS